MTENSDFKTFLSISSNKFGIYLVETKNHKVLYEKDFTVENEYSATDFNNLDKFLKENIFKIEKLIKEFVKNIFLIIDHEKIINHVIGIKKKNLNTKYLTNVLTEAKDLFNKNYNDHKIMHIIINKILIDGNYYPKFLSDQIEIIGIENLPEKFQEAASARIVSDADILLGKVNFYLM